ncbi:hypothetical protein EPA93_05395 [Ktedonosporobacter rubrisoli]|uniref:Uncharacterized protein n=1 Tax=Ktedonosporobacter rubrisoli TaxID=2509675 RepID=A0A4P6JLD2_KTERU|nr:hypothetical protein [Ktedonosporobacter rubrisoli]QBD75466.1 hypothetical protein EPA93_05395 [Ktedonosporobacter rubrisoli]
MAFPSAENRFEIHAGQAEEIPAAILLTDNAFPFYNVTERSVGNDRGGPGVSSGLTSQSWQYRRALAP